MYVVAAVAKHPGPPTLLPGPGWRVQQTVLPVGTRHAVANVSFAPPPGVALCGADVEGWIILEQHPFAARHPASCQRCGQLVSLGRG